MTGRRGLPPGLPACYTPTTHTPTGTSPSPRRPHLTNRAQFSFTHDSRHTMRKETEITAAFRTDWRGAACCVRRRDTRTEEGNGNDLPPPAVGPARRRPSRPRPHDAEGNGNEIELAAHSHTRKEMEITPRAPAAGR